MPLPAANAPTTAALRRIRKRVADSPEGVLCRGCCCAERASPFPTGGCMRIRRRWGESVRCYCAACRVGTPYNCAYANSPKGVPCRWHCCAERRGRRSVPGLCEFAGNERKLLPGAAGDVEDAIPYSGALANRPKLGPCRGGFFFYGKRYPVGGGVPDAPAAAPRFSANLRRIRSRPP